MAHFFSIISTQNPYSFHELHFFLIISTQNPYSFHELRLSHEGVKVTAWSWFIKTHRIILIKI